MQSARIVGTRYGGREAFALFRRRLSPAEDAESAFREFMERHHVPAWLFDRETRKSRRIPPGDWQTRRRLWCNPGEASIKVKHRVTARAITLRKIKAVRVSDNSVYGWQARYRFWFSPDSGLGGYRDTWPWKDGEVEIDRAKFEAALVGHFGSAPGSAEPVVTAAAIAAPPKLASTEAIREAMRWVYDDAEQAGNKPPNVKEAVSGTVARLSSSFHVVRRDVERVADEPGFKGRRVRPGEHFTKPRKLT